MSMCSVNDLTKPLRLQVDTTVCWTPPMQVPSPQPLDLSSSGAFAPCVPTRQCSVIRNVHPQSLLMPLSQSEDSLLPKCSTSSLTPNWIAMKLGAATGPNRMSYPREFKLMVIDYFYANGQNKYRTCKEFQITKSMLNGWLSKVDKIRLSRPGSLKSGRSGRRPQFPDVEKQLYEIYQNRLASGEKQIGNRWIRETARELAQQQCSPQELGGMCQFSERWLSNFKKRYRINLNKDWASSSSSATESTCGSMSTTESPSDTVSDVSDNSQSAVSPVIHSEEEKVNVNVDVVQEMVVDQEDVDKKPQPRGVSLVQFYRQYPWLHRKPTNQSLTYEPGRRGRKVQFPQVEKVLYERLRAKQMAGDRISNRWLQEQARSLAAELCPQVLAQATKSARCMFSEHWLHNFKKRYNVSLKTHNHNLPPQESIEESSPPATPQVNPAMVVQMHQWLVHQYYLSSLAAAIKAQTPPSSDSLLSESH